MESLQIFSDVSKEPESYKELSPCWAADLSFELKAPSNSVTTTVSKRYRGTEKKERDDSREDKDANRAEMRIQADLRGQMPTYINTSSTVEIQIFTFWSTAGCFCYAFNKLDAFVIALHIFLLIYHLTASTVAIPHTFLKGLNNLLDFILLTERSGKRGVRNKSKRDNLMAARSCNVCDFVFCGCQVLLSLF